MFPFLIRVDFIIATALLVVAPLILLAASIRRPAVRGHLLAYWRASSLLMITVYLMIDGRPVAFVAGNAALVLIPLALYVGDVLFIAGDSLPSDSPVAIWFRRWRGSATLFCGASLLLAGPAIRCVGDVEGKAFCTAWLKPPRELHWALHPDVDPAVLGDAAAVGLLIYGAYLIASVGRGVYGAWR